jgi:hypothetical protein
LGTTQGLLREGEYQVYLAIASQYQQVLVAKQIYIYQNSDIATEICIIGLKARFNNPIYCYAHAFGKQDYGALMVSY